MTNQWSVSLALIGMGITAAAAQEAAPNPIRLKDTVPHITTYGFAHAEVVPDVADLTTGVSNERKTADAATEATAKGAEAVIADIKAHGIDPKDIRTSFSLEAQYNVEKNDKGVEINRALRGYDAVEEINVHLHDVKAAGALAREMIETGANSFGGISFTYSKEEQKSRELKGSAMRAALADARAYTDALGLKLGRVLQIGADSDGTFGEADLPSRRPGLIHAPAYIPVEPGVQTLSEQITVVWEIEGTPP